MNRPTRPHPRPTWRMRPLALAIALLGVAPYARALPSGGQTVAGQASISLPGAGQMQINQGSGQAVINWGSFSIAAGESVVVRQPTSTSVLVNQVIGGDPSTLLGRLQANGEVFLLNPSGILFGTGSSIDVGGFLASTLSYQGIDPVTGRVLLGLGSTAPGALQMDGSITARGGVALVAPRLEVGGSIQAARVGLAAATSVAVDLDGDGLIFFDARNDGLATRLDMLGKLQADAGMVDIRAAARADLAGSVLNLDGVVQSRGLSLDGGTVVIDGGAGSTAVAGVVDASGAAPGAVGGHISVLGRQVQVADGAQLLATGDAGGGSIAVGGTIAGAGPTPDDAAPALTTDIASGALLDASATGNGNGGHILAFASLTDTAALLRMAGTLRTEGAGNGQGGFIETSAYGVQLPGTIDTGRGGTWLIDPADITIDATSTGTNSLSASSIQTQLSSGAVVIDATTATGSAANNGSITVNTGLSSSSSYSLTLQAGSIGGTGALDIAGGVIFNLQPLTATTSTYAGIIGGSGGVTLAGNGLGTLVLSAANTYTGNTTISAGTLSIGSDNALGASGTSAGGLVLDGGTLLASSTLSLSTNRAVSLSANGGTLAAATGAVITVAQQVADGSGGAASPTGLRIAGAGTVVLSNSATQPSKVNSYRGGTIVDGGTLQVGLDSQLGATTYGVTLLNGGTLVTTQNLSTSRGVTLSSGVGVFAPATGTTLSLGGSVGGPGSLQLNGAGTLSLGAADTYTGSTTISNGTLVLGAAGALSSGGALVNDATLDLNGHSTSVGSLAGTSSSAVVTNNGSGAATLSVGSDNTSTSYAGALQDGSKPLALTKLGTGTLTLSGTDAYTGATTISAGTLALGSSGALSSGSALVNDATLDLHGYSASAGSLSGGASGVVTNNGATAASLSVGSDNTSTSYAGSLSNGTAALALTKLGTGTLTLTGTDAYTGATTISAGTLALGSASALSSGSALVNDATLDLHGYSGSAGSLSGGASGVVTNNGATAASLSVGSDNTSTSYAGSLKDGSATLALTKLGTGTLTLAGTDTYTGATTISAGTLALGSAGALSSGSALVNDATLDLHGYSGSIGSLSGGASGVVTNNGATAASLSVGSDNTSTSYAGSLKDGSATLALTKLGTGTLTLAGTDTYTGGTTIGAGTLALGSAGALSSGSALVNDATLDLHGYSVTASSLSGSASGAVLTNNGTTAASLSVGSDNTSTSYAGSLKDGSATLALTKLGTGTLTLAGTDTYTGATTIGAGTLALGSAGALSSGSALVNDATLDLNGHSASVGSLAGTSSTAAVTNNGSGSATLSVGSDNTSTSYAGSLEDGSNTLALTKLGTGTLTLSGTDTYTGATTISAGTLVLGSAGALSSGGALINNATLDLDGQSVSVGSLAGTSSTAVLTNNGTTAASLSVGSDNTSTSYAGALQDGSNTLALTKLGTGTLTLSGTDTYTGATTISVGKLVLGSAGALSSGSALVNNATLDLNGHSASAGSLAGTSSTAVVTNNGAGAATLSVGSDNTSTSYAGALQDGSQPLALTKLGTGTLTLAGTDTYTGATTISAGTLVLGSAGALSSGSALVNNATLDLNGYSVSAGSLAGSSSAAVVTNTGASAATLTAGADNTSTSYAGTLKDGSATLALTKVGSGTLTLGGANSHSGGTAVDGGVLAVSADSQLGASAAGVSLDGGELFANVGFASGRSLQLGSAGGTLGVAGGQQLAWYGNLGGAGGLSIVGPGLLSLGGSNSYSGATQIGSLGQLQLLSASALSGSSALSNNGTLDLHGYSVSVGSLAGTGSVTNTALGVATLSVGGDNSSSTFSGTLNDGGISEQLALYKLGTGTLTLTQAGSFSGGTTVAGGALAVSADNQLGNGSLTLAGGTLEATSSFTSARTLNLTGAGGGVAVGSGSTLSWNGNIVGTGGLATAGLGTLQLGGSNTYSGGTSVVQGTLQLASSGALPYGTSLTVDGLLDLNGYGVTVGSLAGSGAVSNPLAASQVDLIVGTDNTSTVFNGSIVGPLALFKIGSGALTLGGSNSYTGNTSIDGGSLVVGSDSALGAAGTTVYLNGATLEAAASFSSARSVVLGSGVDAVQVDAGQTLDLQGPVTSTVSAALHKTGAGMLQLSNTGAVTPNSYGDTSIDSGTLAISQDAQLGSPGNQLILQGGGTLLANASFTSLRPVQLLGTGGEFDTASGSSLQLQGSISGVGALRVGGSGTLVLDGYGNYGGGTQILPGATLQLVRGNAGALPYASPMRNDGTLDLGGNYVYLDALSGSGLITSNTQTGSSSYLYVGLGNGSATYSGAISDGSGLGADRVGLLKYGTGTQTLSGTGSYSAGTYVEGGTLVAGSSSALPSAGNLQVDATLDLGGQTAAVDTLSGAGLITNASTSAAGLRVGVNGGSSSFSGAIDDGIGSVSLTKLGAGTLSLAGNSNYSGGTSLQAGTLQTFSGLSLGTGAVSLAGGSWRISGSYTSSNLLSLDSNLSSISVDSAQTLDQAGAVQGTAGLTKTGAGVLQLSNSGVGSANNYSGPTQVLAGSLRVGSDAALPAGTVMVDDGVLDLDGHAAAVGTLAGSGQITNQAAAPSSLEVGLGGASGSFSGNIVDGSGSVALIKSGSGTLLLSGTDSYTGGTTINAGTLTLGSYYALPYGGSLIDNGALDANGLSWVVLGGLSGNGSISTSVANPLTVYVGANAASSSFGGVISDGAAAVSLYKYDVGTLTLTGANTYTGGTIIGSGTLRLGPGGQIATAVQDYGSLDFATNSAVQFDRGISGSGQVQVWNGTLTFGLAGVNSYSGATLVHGGELVASAASALSPNSAVGVDSAGSLWLKAAQNVASINAAGAVELDADLSSAGDQSYGGVLTLGGSAPQTLTAGGNISALNPANQLGTMALSLHAANVQLADPQALTLGDVTLGAGGQFTAPSITLDGTFDVQGGTASLIATAAPDPAHATDVANASVPVAIVPLAIAQNTVHETATGSVQVAPGAELDIAATGGGSVDLGQASNQVLGALSVLSGPAFGTAWQPNPQSTPSGVRGVQSQVLIDGGTIEVGGQGIEADLVNITAATLGSPGGAVIAARMPYDALLLGQSMSVPSMSLTLTPASFALLDPYGAPGGKGIPVSIGSTLLGMRTVGPDAGYMVALPFNVGNPSAAVFLKGPPVTTGGYRLFVEGNAVAGNIPVFYNDYSPQTPQISSALSSVSAVSEAARQALFQQAVRTENVAGRLHAGVIAEVGPGRPATEGTGGAALPASCEPKGLTCASN